MQATTTAANTAVMTSPSFVIVPREAAIEKLIWGIALLGIGLAVFTALMVLLSALLPWLREQARASLKIRPWLVFLTGVVGYAALAGLGWMFWSNATVEYLLRTEYIPGMAAGAVIVCAIMTLLTFAGATGVIQAIGERLEKLNGREMSGLRKTSWGALILATASLFPGIGWFLVLPISLPLAFGSALWALMLGRRDL